MGIRVVAVVLALGIALGANAGSATPPGEVTAPSLPTTTNDEADPDTVYTARMKPILVIGKHLDEDPRRLNEEATRLAGDGQDTPRRRASESRRGATEQHDDTERGVAIGGFVMDETFSVIGNDFYTAFYSVWSEPEEATLYTVYVREEPAPQFGARLSVEVGDTMIFRTFLRPNNKKIQEAAQQAARRAQIYLEKYYEPRQVY